MRKVFYSCAWVSLLFLSTCRESPTIIDDTPVGRRDYTWTNDTLRDQPGDLIWPFDIWGNSPDDVWIVGHGDESDQCKWHFDGTKWRKDSIRLSSNLNSVYGFAQNDIWICEGPGGRIFHYDGSKWRLFGDYEPQDSMLYLANIYGDAPNNIYIVGHIVPFSGESHGIMMHYDGKDWSFVNIPFLKTALYSIRKDYSSGLYFIWGVKQTPMVSDTIEIYKFDGNRMECIYSNVGLMSFVEIGNSVFFHDGKCIYRYFGGNLTVWKDFSELGFMQALIKGRNHRDIVAARSGIVYELIHYNGNDWAPILQVGNLPIWDMFLFSSDIFVVMHNFNSPIIFHGTLN